MSSVAGALTIITRSIALLNAAIVLTGNSEKYRELVARAVNENRDITDLELQRLARDAEDAIEKLKP